MGFDRMYALLRRLLFVLPAESAHRLAFFVLRVLEHLPGGVGLVRLCYRVPDPRLVTHAFGVQFDSPIGLAAGFDKDAEAPNALAAFGFGHVEVGTVTARPQPGNPRPRLFRLPADRALLNRMGFNNHGADAMASRLRGTRRVPIGVNLGKTKLTPEAETLADYEYSARRLAGRADYLVVNVSSPNTPGLRSLQAVEHLRPLLKVVRAAADDASPGRRVPLLVKIAPDLSDADVDAVADLALELSLDGIIATNTTIAREGLRTPRERVEALGAGGVSGAPVANRSIEVLRRLRARVGDRVTLVSVGGVFTSGDAWERIRAGATLVQVYTAFIYEGPGLVRRMLGGLRVALDRGGYPAVQAAVGSDAAEPGAVDNAGEAGAAHR